MPGHDYLAHSQSELDAMRKEEEEFDEYYEETGYWRCDGKAPSFTEWKRKKMNANYEEIQKQKDYEKNYIDWDVMEIVEDHKKLDAKVKELPDEIKKGLNENNIYSAMYWDVKQIEDEKYSVFVYSEINPMIFIFENKDLIYVRDDKRVFYFKLNEEQKSLLF